jgi:hypothetical protein
MSAFVGVYVIFGITYSYLLQYNKWNTEQYENDAVPPRRGSVRTLYLREH